MSDAHVHPGPTPTTELPPAAAGRSNPDGGGRPGVVYLDGRWLAPEEATVSVFDHGLLYGDGVFEGIRYYDGRVFRLERHVERFYRSASMIGLTMPVPPEEMSRIILATCARSGLRSGYIRPVVTRGPGDLGIDPRSSPRPSLIVICSTIRAFGTRAVDGIRLVSASRRKIPPAALDPNVKSLNYLTSVLAKAEANAAGADEALLLDLDGNVAEASTENVFVVRDGRIFTPPTTHTLEGVTREAILELSRDRYPTEVRFFPPEFLRAADEVFLVGTGAELLPVVALDGHAIGTGHPGPVTRSLLRAYHDLVRSSGTPIPYATESR